MRPWVQFQQQEREERRERCEREKRREKARQTQRDRDRCKQLVISINNECELDIVNKTMRKIA
jgi:hypothetical protein